MLQESNISETNCAKNLGVWIDHCVSMERHVNELCKTCLFFINWIRNICPCLTIAITKSIVQALIISRIDYCNALLFALPSYHVNNIQRVMNISARLIFRTPRDCSVSYLLMKLHWLRVEDRVKFKILTPTWKSINNMTPDYILCLIEPKAPPPNLRSSSRMNLHVPRTRTRFGERSFRYAAPKLWNDLPLGIRRQQNFSVFKRAVKPFFIQECV